MQNVQLKKKFSGKLNFKVFFRKASQLCELTTATELLVLKDILKSASLTSGFFVFGLEIFTHRVSIQALPLITTESTRSLIE